MWREFVDTLKGLDFLFEGMNERRLFWSITGGLGGLVFLVLIGFSFSQWWHFRWWQDAILYVALLAAIAAATYIIVGAAKNRRDEKPQQGNRLAVLVLVASLCLVAVMLVGSMFGEPLTMPVLVWWLTLTTITCCVYLARRKTKLRAETSNRNKEPNMSNDHNPDSETPEAYSDTHHPKYFVKRLPAIVALELALGLAVVVLWLLPSQQETPGAWYLIGRMGATLIILFAMIVCGYRPYWRWRTWRYRMNPVDGQLRIYEPGHRLLLIRGSSPNTISIDEVEIDTPQQSILEQYIFTRSQTLILRRGDTIVFMRNDMRDVDLIRRIKQYRSGLTRRSTETLSDLLEVSNENNRLLRSLIAIGEETNRLLAMAIEPPGAPAIQPPSNPAGSVDSPEEL